MASSIVLFGLLATVAGAHKGERTPHECICPLLYDPVCASNGQIFSNKCLIRCHNLEENDQLEIVGFHRCSKNYASHLNKKHFSNACTCPRIYDPVCASNGQIFSNTCMMKCYNDEHNKHLVAVDAEQCSSQETVMAASQQCVCTKEFNPVCGSNHRTYSNPCVFRCAARRTPGLRIIHHSRCNRRP